MPSHCTPSNHAQAKLRFWGSSTKREQLAVITNLLRENAPVDMIVLLSPALSDWTTVRSSYRQPSQSLHPPLLELCLLGAHFSRQRNRDNADQGGALSRQMRREALSRSYQGPLPIRSMALTCDVLRNAFQSIRASCQAVDCSVATTSAYGAVASACTA